VHTILYLAKSTKILVWTWQKLLDGLRIFYQLSSIIENTTNQRRSLKSNSPDEFVYRATLDRIVDGDPFDCILDLGFDVKLHKQRVRLAGIDTPESRTRNLAEKALGLKAKERLKELCVGTFKVKSLGKGKYGRILGIPYTEDGEDICAKLIEEGHAVEYQGGTKTKVWG